MNILFGNSSPWGESSTQEQNTEYGYTEYSENNGNGNGWGQGGNGNGNNGNGNGNGGADVPVDNGIIFVVIFAIIFAMKRLAIEKIKPLEK